MSWMKISCSRWANSWSRFAWEKCQPKMRFIFWKSHLGEMKSRPLAPSPVKQRWMLLMNFLNKKPLLLIFWNWNIHLSSFTIIYIGAVHILCQPCKRGKTPWHLTCGKGKTSVIIFISVIEIMIGVTSESISSCRRREPIVCLVLRLCLLQTRPVCWSKGWWSQMMAIWWFSGIKRGRGGGEHDCRCDIWQKLHRSLSESKLRLKFISMRKIFICYDTFIASHRPLTTVYVAPQGTSGIGGHRGRVGGGG